MKVWFDLYKPSGKWYAGGAVEMEDQEPFDPNESILETFWRNQDFMNGNCHKSLYTIISDDLDSARNDSEYKTLWKQVLQIGRDS